MPQNLTSKNKTCYIDTRTEHSGSRIGAALKDCIASVREKRQELVFLCIGSDRITGDCLGPLIGHQLCRSSDSPYTVYGTLEHPVHALNLTEVLSEIQYNHPSALVVAIDASLGSLAHQGCVCIGCGSILPGAGVCKKLPPVGDIFITGIVNLSGASAHLLLSSTRLCDVMQMADAICQGILLSCLPACAAPFPCRSRQGWLQDCLLGLQAHQRRVASLAKGLRSFS